MAIGALPIVFSLLGAAGSYLSRRKSSKDQANAINKANKSAVKKLDQAHINQGGTGLYGSGFTGLGPAMLGPIYNWLQNPGQTSTVQYERAQENSEVMNRAAQQALGGAFSGAGWGSNPAQGGLYGSLIASTLMGLAKQRNEAGRNQALLEETLKRQDQSQGLQAAMGILEQILGLQKAKAATRAGQPIPQAGPNAYGALGNAFSMFGQYSANNPGMFGGGAGSAAAQSYTGGGGGGGINPNQAGSAVDYFNSIPWNYNTTGQG